MKYILTASTSMGYGLLIHFKIYSPARFNPGEYYGLFFIFLGIISFIAIPFVKKLNHEETDKKISNKDILLQDKCSIPKVIGIILFILYMFEIFVSDFIFVLSLILILFCQSIVGLFRKEEN
jgi:hypothetical protein